MDARTYKYAIALGILDWLFTFFVVGYAITHYSSTYQWTIFTILLFTMVALVYTIQKIKLSDWLMDSAMFGLVITTVNFVLDYVLFMALGFSFGPYMNALMVAYPLAIPFAIVAAYLTRKKKR
jgi:hypothetical protein